MDQPTAALGVNEQRKVKELVRGLRDVGVCGDDDQAQPEKVLEVADRLLVTCRGRLVGTFQTPRPRPTNWWGLMVGTTETPT